MTHISLKPEILPPDPPKTYIITLEEQADDLRFDLQSFCGGYLEDAARDMILEALKVAQNTPKEDEPDVV